MNMPACTDNCATSIACYLSTCLDSYDLDEGKWTAPYEGCEAARACKGCFPNKPSGCGCTAAAIEDEEDGCVMTMSPTTAKPPTPAPVPLLEVTLKLETKPTAEEEERITEDFCKDYAEANSVDVKLLACKIEYAESRRRLLAVEATLSVTVAPDADPVEVAKIPKATDAVMTAMATKVTESVTAVTGKAPTEDPVVEVPAGPGAMEDPADDYSAAGRVGVAVAVVALLAANLLC